MPCPDIKASEVIEELPFAQGSVSKTSTGLNLPMVERFITEATGILSAILKRHNMSYDALDADAAQVVRTGIKAYAKAQCLIKREFPDSQIQLQMGIWRDSKDTLRDSIQDLGASQVASNQVVSNIDTSEKYDKWVYNGKFKGF